MTIRFLAAAAVATALLATPAPAQQRADAVQPEAASGVTTKPLVRAKTQMVAAAHPLAAEAGLTILRAGGNAIDAMVTVQLVLGLVEPQSSGLGGGAFLVYYDAGERRLTTFDGRETAPAASRPELFLDAKGQPLDFLPAVVGGRSVGTPGTVKLLAETHGRFGALPFARLAAPAIALARNGFPLSPRLHALLADDETLPRSPTLAAYLFGPNGKPLPEGTRLVNEAYAQTLEAIAAKGAEGFYEGPVADDMVAAVAAATGLDGKPQPGTLALGDLAAYRVKERAPVCAPYRVYEVCGMGPPSSGAVAVGQILSLAGGADVPAGGEDLAALGPGSAEAWRRIGEASRLAFADRGRYLADDDFLAVPVRGLLDPAYLSGRARLLSGPKALPAEAVVPGEPSFDHAGIGRGDDASLELPSTSHFVIVDGARNVVSMTTTIENGFGSRVMSGGFLLNNEMTDFSFETHEDGRPIANAVAPGKRPRSSMAPTIVMQGGSPVIALGSPGGSRIIGYVAGALFGLLDWGLDPQQAASLPHVVNRFGAFDLEKGTSAEELGPALRAMGFEAKASELNSGLHIVRITPDGLEGGADPRREGVAVGN